MRRTTTLAAALLILASSAITPAAGGERPRGATGPLVPWQSPLRVWGPLGSIWHETEGGWQGVWRPVGSGGVYRAEWRLGRQIERADLRISLDGDAVTVTRTQPQGGCIYHGTMVRGSTPGTARITGGYHCDWAPKTMYWSATIDG